MKSVDHHFPYLPERIAKLEDLAYNLWFSWHSAANSLFKRLDPHLRENVSNNPIRQLHEIDSARLNEMATDTDFLKDYDLTIAAFEQYMNDKTHWFGINHTAHINKTIAYFSMEFGIHECLPIYSGGLGILAGDHLKSASDLGIPLVAVGLLYRESYFTQFVSLNGHQQSLYVHNDFSDMPVWPVTDENGDPVVIHIEVDHHEMAVRIWQAQVGRVPLYLLDTDFPENNPEYRCTTERLYSGNRDTRLIQESILGIGGVKALQTMGIQPDVYHLNEGHCSLLLIERMKQEIENGATFDQAVETVRNSAVFTTHTPIPAGNEVFERMRVKKYLSQYFDALHLDEHGFMTMAAETRNPDYNAFNMTILALKHTMRANGVSQLHGQVSRKMWHGIWPEKSVEDVPIDAITNGVHIRTWMSSLIKYMLDDTIGSDWRYNLSDTDFWKQIDNIPNETLWKTHNKLKDILAGEVRCRIMEQRERNGETQPSIDEAGTLLDTNMLTIGFARRFAPYKRGTILFRDRDRLKSIIASQDRPLQIIFAGKAHPANQPGKALIQEIYRESRNPEFAGRIIFVEDYDMALARKLVSGVDIWLNTPRRPLEASGTSGMKAAANGAVNLSILDGWWRECYHETNGWAIGEDREYYNEWEQDESDSNSLYWLLENKILPLYYEKDQNGLPAKWIQMMKNSMKTVIPFFNTHRMLKAYVDKMYLPVLEK